MEGIEDTNPVPVIEETEIFSATTIGPGCAEPMASGCRGGRDGSEDNLKENWKRALRWTCYIHGFDPEVDPGFDLEVDLWFARVVEKLRVDPYLDSSELEIDKSPLGQFLPGANMNSLDLAILMGDLSMVEKILERSSVPDNLIRGPIQDLSKNRKFLQSTPIFDVSTKTGILYTPLHLAVDVGDMCIVDVLLEKGADVNALNWQGQTPLDLACKKGNFSMLDRLLVRDTKENKSPFHVAVRLGDVDFVNGLPPKNINAVDHKKMTPLHLAVEGGHSNIVSVLVERGADVNVKNGEDQTPLDLVCKKRNLGLLERLLAKDEEKKKPIHVAVHYGDVELMKKVEKLSSLNANAVDRYGRTPLHYLARECFPSSKVTNIVQCLAKDKAFDMKILDDSSCYGSPYSAFYLAVHCCNTNFVIALLDSYKDKVRLNEACDKKLGPPIQIAIEKGDKFKDIERALMECDPVKSYMAKLYRDRQVYVDATNAILVGAALIASVTFASWLQPPLSYTSYFGEGSSSSIPSPSTSDLNYVDVEHNIALRAFWVFNALSFYFAIATVVCGARSVIPRPHLFIEKIVENLRTNLLVTSILLACSVLFVIVAFAIAGTLVLTPQVKYQWCMIVPTIVGGMVCITSLGALGRRMVEYCSKACDNSEGSDKKG